MVLSTLIHGFERVSFNGMINREWTRAWQSYVGL